MAKESSAWLLGVCTIFNKAFLYKQGIRIWLGAFFFQLTTPTSRCADGHKVQGPLCELSLGGTFPLLLNWSCSLLQVGYSCWVCRVKVKSARLSDKVHKLVT